MHTRASKRSKTTWNKEWCPPPNATALFDSATGAAEEPEPTDLMVVFIATTP
jgi:hypothetical protein